MMLLRVSLVSFALASCGKVEMQSQVHDAPPVPVDVAVDAVPCVASDATFTHTPGILNMPVTFTPTTGLSYTWTFMNGTPPTSAAEKPVVTWNAAGTDTVSLTVSTPGLSCPSATSMQSVPIVTCKTTTAPATLNMATSGHTNSGLTITATVDTTLTGFTVINQNQADNAVLLAADGTTVLQTTPIPALMPSYVANVSWPLVAGTTYHLVTALGNNNEFAELAASPFPTGNGSISVTASWLDNSNTTQYWFAFSNLQSCP